MDARNLQELAAACGGELRGGAPSLQIRRVTTDSRDARPGDLFVALAGERFDGHDFLVTAAGHGVTAALVSRARAAELPATLPAIVVEDPRIAFGRIASEYRRDFDLPVVCVAGSNGKTTTKELIAAVLGAAFPTLKSAGSYNNDIGVPASLLRLERQHHAAVFEAGTNHPGELAPLVRLIAPRIGVVTSIGREHLEFFGTVEGVVDEEGWLPELLPAADHGGVLILPGSMPQTGDLVRRTRARVIRAGLGAGNDWQAGIRAMDWSGTTFSVRAPDEAWNGEYTMILPGRHSVGNALLALVVAHELGLAPDLAREGLSTFQPAPQRLNLVAAGGVNILDDTYNANADSMLAALQTLSDLPCTGRRIAVVGDMAELGQQSEQEHVEVGRAASRLEMDSVFAVGRFAAVTAAASGAGRGRAFPDVDSVATALAGYVRAGDAVLVKASRSSRLERVVSALLAHLDLREAALVSGDL